VTVAAVVVAHGPEPELSDCVRALSPQVDELVLVVNTKRALPPLPQECRLVENSQPQGFAANANRGIACTEAPFVVVSNADAVAEPEVVSILLALIQQKPHCGMAGPELRYPDGSWQLSRRRFPTVGGTFWRRSPLRYILPPQRLQRSHYLFDDRPTIPVEADWMLGAFLLLRRAALDDVGGFDEGFRLYGEDIDLCYRMERAGWERWYVPEAVVRHTYPAIIDRRFLTRQTVWHLQAMARFVRKHPESLLRL
jgi:GT2 family glycosyltransferase